VSGPVTEQSAADRPAPGTAARVLVVMHEADAGLGRLEQYLTAGGTVVLDVRRPYQGDPLPDHLTGFAALVVLGGAMGAADDEAAGWLPATRRLLAAGVEAGLPTVGICLGAQLLAAATGGQVRRGAGLEVGLVDVRTLPAAGGDPLLAALGGEFGPEFGVAQWHQDEISELPPGAVLLATGDRYPHQVFRLGDRAWGIQYHPEVTLADFTDWMRDGHGSVRGSGQDPERVLDELARAEEHLERLGRAHALALRSVLSRSATTPAPG
jgi:GMP synthase (glutamine-hydrolysing)